MRYFGVFYGKAQEAPACVRDLPVCRMGAHALWAEDTASDGGAMALAIGRMRNAQSVRQAILAAGTLGDPGEDASALVLGAYRLWGERYPRHIEGALASVVMDQDARRLILARDRMGQKRMLYAGRGTSVAFADHPEALLATPLAAPVVDRTGLCELFALGPARTPGRTPLRDICELTPGTMLIVDGHGSRLEKYFSLVAATHTDDTETTVATVRALLTQAVDECLTLAPAAMLSGGLDSSILTAFAARAGTVRTYSVDYLDDVRYFEQNAYQHARDNPFAEQAAKAFHTEHTRVVLAPDALMDALVPAMLSRGFPGMGDVDGSLYQFAKRIGARERYVLSGECADEVFGGYPWFHREDLIAMDSFPWSGSMPLRERILRKELRDRLKLSDYQAARYFEACARVPTCAHECAKDARLRRIHGMCLDYFMPNLQERALCVCAAHDVEVLTPFIDERLAQYVFNVPWPIKNLGGREKGLLRAAARELLPKELLYRRKSPYPKTHHPAYTELVVRATRKMLADHNAPINALIDPGPVERMIGSGLNPADSPWYGQLMTGVQMLGFLLQVNAWCEKYQIEFAS